MFLVIILSSIASIIAYNVLSFSGGGSFGSIEIGLLKCLREMQPLKYDLYAGISVGGLNAGFLSFFADLDVGVIKIQEIYKDLKNKDVYELFPVTTSLLNTEPLHKTITKILFPYNESVIETIIGTTNLYTGKLDIYNYHELNHTDKSTLLMATSAIPIVFPPIIFNNNLYVDGGAITNELLTEIQTPEYIYITFITPHSNIATNYNLTSFQEIVKRNIEVLGAFNNEISKMNCLAPRGEIMMYYVESDLIANYSMLDFNYGEELFNIGYHNLKSDKYPLC